MSAAWVGVLHAWLFWAAAPIGACLLVGLSVLRGATWGDEAERRRQCRCNHLFAVHEHYRAGTDCGVCGPTRCARFVAGDVHRARTTPLPVDHGVTEHDRDWDAAFDAIVRGDAA